MEYKFFLWNRYHVKTIYIRTDLSATGKEREKVNKNQRRSEVMCITFIEHIMFTILLWESSKTAIYVCISRESKL